MTEIYVASSWRNKDQPRIVSQLRYEGHEVYDFRNPAEGNNGFRWSEIDEEWEQWSPAGYREALNHPVAEAGFKLDKDAMDWADTCVLVLPSGRSAHSEAGYMAGQGKNVHVYIGEPCEPELMYKLYTSICLDIYELLDELKAGEAE